MIGWLIELAEVYPRVGGGNKNIQVQSEPHYGLSPRGRGKRPPGRGRARPYRSIPAWAGETAQQRLDNKHFEVYPRVGGGNAANPPPRPAL